MHFLIGIGVLAALVAYAFGETAARILIGTVLGMGALLVLFAVGVVILDESRQPATHYVQMGPGK